MILKANPATVNTPSAHVNAQCGCLQSGFPQTHMFSTEFLIYSTQSFSYCIQSCSRQYQNLEKTFIRKQTFFNHTEKSQSNLGLEVRMLPYPMGLPRLKAGLRRFPQQWLSSSLCYGLFWALSSKLLHHIHNSSGISIFIKHFERYRFHPKRGKEGIISAVPQEGNICLPKRY